VAFAFNPSYSNWDVQKSGGTFVAITFFPDGSITNTGNIVNATATQFLTPTSTGAAAGYSVRMRNDGTSIIGSASFTAFGETPSTGNWTSWYVLTSNRVIQASGSTPGVNTIDLDFTVEIRNDSTLSTISVIGFMSKF
jgi:hypothetical protein